MTQAATLKAIWDAKASPNVTDTTLPTQNVTNVAPSTQDVLTTKDATQTTQDANLEILDATPTLPNAMLSTLDMTPSTQNNDLLKVVAAIGLLVDEGLELSIVRRFPTGFHIFLPLLHSLTP